MASQEEVRLIIKAFTEQAVKAISDLNKKMQDNENAGNSLSKSWANIKSHWLAYSAAVYGVIKVANYAIESASNLTEQQNKFNVVFDDTPQVLKLATLAVSDLTENYAMSRREATQYMAEIGNLLKAMGKSPQAAEEMSASIVKLAADLGSFNNVPTTEALMALRSALVGETEPIRRLGADVSAVTLKMEAMKLGITGNVTELDRGTKMQLIYNAILRQTSDAQGDMIRTADSYANVSKKLNATLEDSAAQLGENLLPAATAGKGVLIDFFQSISSGVEIWHKAIIMAVTAWYWMAGQIELAYYKIKIMALQAAKWISDPIIDGINVVINNLNKLPGTHMEVMNKMSENSVKAAEAEIRIREIQINNLMTNYENEMALIGENNALKEEQEALHQENLGIIAEESNARTVEREQLLAGSLLTIEEQRRLNRYTKEKADNKARLDQYKAFTAMSKMLDADLVANKLQQRGLDTSSYMQWSNFMMSAMNKDSKTQFKLWQALAIQQATINTYQAAIAGYNAMAGIPIVGPALGAVAAAAAITFGLLQVKKIASADFKGAEEGALIRGSAGNGTLLRAGENNKDEAIIPLDNEEAQEKLGGMGGTVNVNFNSDYIIADREFPESVAKQIDIALFKLKQQNLSRAFA